MVKKNLFMYSNNLHIFYVLFQYNVNIISLNHYLLYVVRQDESGADCGCLPRHHESCENNAGLCGKPANSRWVLKCPLAAPQDLQKWTACDSSGAVCSPWWCTETARGA
jgi:hypothetical protein